MIRKEKKETKREEKARKETKMSRTITDFLKEERGKGKPKPNRRAIEAQIARIDKLRKKEIGTILSDMHKTLLTLGVLNARRPRVRGPDRNTGHRSPTAGNRSVRGRD